MQQEARRRRTEIYTQLRSISVHVQNGDQNGDHHYFSTTIRRAVISRTRLLAYVYRVQEHDLYNGKPREPALEHAKHIRIKAISTSTFGQQITSKAIALTMDELIRKL